MIIVLGVEGRHQMIVLRQAQYLDVMVRPGPLQFLVKRGYILPLVYVL